jgi:hypothetical protein
MPVTVHLRSGLSEERREATSCEWVASSGNPRSETSPQRWLVCRNARGEAVATYPESEVNGYMITRGASSPRFRFFRPAEPARR